MLHCIEYIVRANLKVPQFLKIERYVQRLSYRVCMGDDGSGWWAPICIRNVCTALNENWFTKLYRLTLRKTLTPRFNPILNYTCGCQTFSCIKFYLNFIREQLSISIVGSSDLDVSMANLSKVNMFRCVTCDVSLITIGSTFRDTCTWMGDGSLGNTVV